MPCRAPAYEGAARELSALAGSHDLAERYDRRAEALAWRATALRRAAEELATAEAYRRARSAARIAYAAALDAAAMEGVGPMNRAALAQAQTELGHTALALGSAGSGPVALTHLHAALGHFEAAADSHRRLGHAEAARVAAHGVTEASARIALLAP